MTQHVVTAYEQTYFNRVEAHLVRLSVSTGADPHLDTSA
jgi:hypothetical protein